MARLEVSHFSPSQDRGDIQSSEEMEKMGRITQPSADGCHVPWLFCDYQHGGPMQFIQFGRAREKQEVKKG